MRTFNSRDIACFPDERGATPRLSRLLPMMRKRKVDDMSLRTALRQQYDIIGSLQPATHVPQNWNYEIPSSLYRPYMHPPHDVRRHPDVPVQYDDSQKGRQHARPF